MRDVMKYSAEAFAERMLLEGDLQGNRIVLQLLQQRSELLEALKKSKELREVERMMAAIERTRNRGNYGIAVAEDDRAKEWQSLRKDADFLRSVIDSAITKAEAVE